MTEQELRDGEAYQASPSGTAAALVFELERIINTLEEVANKYPDSLTPEFSSIILATQRLQQLQVFCWNKRNDKWRAAR